MASVADKCTHILLLWTFFFFFLISENREALGFEHKTLPIDLYVKVWPPAGGTILGND